MHPTFLAEFRSDWFQDNLAEIPEWLKTLFHAHATEGHSIGRVHWSANGILSDIRWNMRTVMGDEDFKINSKWSSYLARWLLVEYPEFDDGVFFEMRRMRSNRRHNYRYWQQN